MSERSYHGATSRSRPIEVSRALTHHGYLGTKPLYVPSVDKQLECEKGKQWVISAGSILRRIKSFQTEAVDWDDNSKQREIVKDGGGVSLGCVVCVTRCLASHYPALA